MAQYLISFNDGDMTFPESDLPEVAKLDWAARIAVACRCAQEVREFLSAPAR